jgi:hypothetical protein
MKVSKQLQASLSVQNNHYLQNARPALLLGHDKSEKMVKLLTFYLSVLKQKLADFLCDLILFELVLWNNVLQNQPQIV